MVTAPIPPPPRRCAPPSTSPPAKATSPPPPTQAPASTSHRRRRPGRKIDPADLQPGDIAVFDDHTAIVAGNGQLIGPTANCSPWA
ncbi:hypothetical protein I552_0527 [Mycobacterium xenopi 3993]|nr:hypothetical protein I552_0527 [Mycobacterium xenopi 3993]